MGYTDGAVTSKGEVERSPVRPEAGAVGVPEGPVAVSGGVCGVAKHGMTRGTDDCVLHVSVGCVFCVLKIA